MLLVSLGAEEVCQGGIYGFAGRHPEFDRERTWFLNVETVGSCCLVLMEEGTVVMEDYYDRPFRDLIARSPGARASPCAGDALAQLRRRGDPQPRPSYPIATIASMNRFKAMSNYHLMSDTPENIDYATVERAVDLAEDVPRAHLAPTTRS